MPEEQFLFHASGSFKLDVDPRGDPETLAIHFEDMLNNVVLEWLRKNVVTDSFERQVVEVKHRPAPTLTLGMDVSEFQTQTPYRLGRRFTLDQRTFPHQFIDPPGRLSLGRCLICDQVKSDPLHQ